MAVILTVMVISVLGGLCLFSPSDSSNSDAINEVFVNLPNSSSNNLHIVLTGSVIEVLALISAEVIMKFLSA